MPYNHRCTQAPNYKETRKFADIDPLLMGMASQRAEREDNMIVEDLRGNVFGPLEFSRRDLMAVNIQRGRDHGTPDYNTAREAFGLPRLENVTAYIESTGSVTPSNIVQDMETLHRDQKHLHHCEEKLKKCGNFCTEFQKKCEKYRKEAWENIDVWTGGILETSERPGPLFRAIIKDQFIRIRNADRFWFENEKWEIP